jgi:hypothetical protein
MCHSPDPHAHRVPCTVYNMFMTITVYNMFMGVYILIMKLPCTCT